MLTTTVPATTTTAPGFLVDRSEIYALVKAQSCLNAKYVLETLSYGDLYDLLMEFINTFVCSVNLNYLESLIETVDDAIRLSYGVYHEKTLTDVTGAKFIHKTSVSGKATINANQRELVIINSSSVNEVHVMSGAVLSNLIISGNSSLASLIIDPGCIVENIFLKTCAGANATAATLTKIIGVPSQVYALTIEEGAVFGGFDCAPATTTSPSV